MAIDTIFKPTQPTILVVAGGVQLFPQGSGQGTSIYVRVVNLSATAQRLGYDTTAAKALANAIAPTAAGVYSLTIPASGVTFLEFSKNMFFAADNGTGFELTPGM